MKSTIALLIDFTQATEVVLSFGRELASRMSAAILLVHISDAKKSDAANKELFDMQAKLELEGYQVAIAIEEGNFFQMIRPLLIRKEATMAIIGTHGKIGFKQNFFGSNILKLVKLIGVPALVVQSESKFPAGGFSSALIPVGSHVNYDQKIEQTIGVMNPDFSATLYAIDKLAELDEKVQKNLDRSAKFLEEAGIDFQTVREPATLYSVGYSRQTLEYLVKQPHTLISIMSQVAPESKFYGDADKENVILNPMGVPVLCCS
jgi:nucleotide-binding universal stress UspA family protein